MVRPICGLKDAGKTPLGWSICSIISIAGYQMNIGARIASAHPATRQSCSLPTGVTCSRLWATICCRVERVTGFLCQMDQLWSSDSTKTWKAEAGRCSVCWREHLGRYRLHHWRVCGIIWELRTLAFADVEPSSIPRWRMRRSSRAACRTPRNLRKRSAKRSLPWRKPAVNWPRPARSCTRCRASAKRTQGTCLEARLSELEQAK